MLHFLKYSFRLTTLLLIATNTFGQSYFPPVPQVVYPYEFENNGLTDERYFLLTPFRLATPPSSPDYRDTGPIIVDQNGALVWYADGSSTISTIDFKYYPTQQQYSYSIVHNDTNMVVIMDNQFAIVDTLRAINGEADIHDVQRAANGNWLLTMEYYDTVDLSAYTFGPVQGSATTRLMGFGWQEIDPGGNLVYEWNSNDHIDPTEFYNFYGYSPNPFDYCHGNAVEEDADGNILLSFRHLNAIYKINRMSGGIIWRLGGQSSDFTFPNDDGFSGQHDIRRLPNGHYSLFDNANMMQNPKVSRGVEYELDTVNWTATMINEVVHPEEFFARAMGNYQQTSDGQSMICYGLVYRPEPTATLFDAGELPLVQFFFGDSVVSYRCHIEPDLTINRPEITCDFDGNDWRLTAVDPAAEYLWSTGETTTSIAITQTGYYQLWVPGSTGHLGSTIVHVTDINNPCSFIGLEELSAQAEQSFVLYDLLGHRVANPKPDCLYIKLFADGTTEKWVSSTNY
ncbi:MAG: arylsulfotransferase family protein [Bacteroidota bacterium]